MERVGDRQGKMEGYCLTGQSRQWAVVPMEEVDEYIHTHIYTYIYMYTNNGWDTHIRIHTYTVYEIYRVSQEEWKKLRESVPYVKLYRYNPKHLYPKLNGYGDNGQRSLKV